MGLADVFNAEDRVDVTKSELFDFMQCKASNRFLINGLKNGVKPVDIMKMLDIKEMKEMEEK